MRIKMKKSIFHGGQLMECGLDYYVSKRDGERMVTIGEAEEVKMAPARYPIVGGVATHTPRLETLYQSIVAMVHSVDELHVYCNDFDPPPWLRAYQECDVILHEAPEGNLRGFGKWYGFKEVEYETFYYLTFDDDILYPKDYSEKIVDGIERHNAQAPSVVGIHGATFEKNARTLTQRSFSAPFQTGLKNDTRCHYLGFGTLGVRSDVYQPDYDIDDLRTDEAHNMGDIARKGVQKWCLARPGGWLGSIPVDSGCWDRYIKEKEWRDRIDGALRAALPDLLAEYTP